VLFVGLLQPSAAFAAATVTLVAPFDHTVMGNGPTRLQARVTNDASGAVDRVEFRFNNGGNDAYDYALLQQSTAPAGWSVTVLTANRAEFTAGSAGVQIPNNGSLDFTLWLIGNAGTEISRANTDQADRWDQVIIRHGAGPTDTLAGPTWARHGFKLTLEATPASAPVGGAVVLRYLVENRTSSAVSKTGIASIPAAPTVVPAGAVTGPAATSPATLPALAQNAAGEMSWTGTAQVGPSASFRARVLTNAGGTTSSPTVDSNAVAIGRFTAVLEVAPTSGISGSTFNVAMTVTNHDTTSLGGVTPSRDPVTRSAIVDPLSIGTAGVVKTSGPVPPSVSSLGPGDSVVFRWVYTATGAAGTTVRFQGGAIANGTPNVTGLAVSNAAEIVLKSFGVTPGSISNSGPLTFTAGNGTAFDFLENFRFNFPNGFAVSSVTPVAGYTAVISGGDKIVTYTRVNDTVFWNAGETLEFPMNFSAVPPTTGSSDQEFLVELLLTQSNETYLIPVLVTENRLTLAFAPASVPADGTSTVTVTASLTNGALTPAPLAGRTVTFETTAGTLSSGTAVTNGAGQAIVTLTAPASATAVTATVTASHYNTVEVGTVPFTAFAGANLLYIGGSLFQRQVAPANLVAFSVYVENVGSLPAVLTTLGTHFDFTCTTATGTAVYTSPLSAPMTVAAGATALLDFASVAIPATCVSTPDQVLFPTFTFNPVRTITDTLTITATPTFASVVGFGVEPWGSGVRLSWATELEWDNLGFRILRADDAGEPEYLDAFVPATGALFADYEAFDEAPPSASLRAWWIEDVAMDGTASRHGPVFLASPGASPGTDPVAAAPAFGLVPGAGERGPDEAVWLDPYEPGDVRVLERDATGLTLEIVPPPFEVTQVPWPVALRDRFRIAGYGVVQEYGLPDLPVRPVAVPLPPNTRGRLTVREVDALEHNGFAPTWWAGAAQTEDPFAAPSGPMRDLASFSRDVSAPTWPDRAVSLVEAGRAGDRALGTLVVHPLRWRSGDGVLVQTTRLVVRVDFVGTEPHGVDAPSVAEERQREIVGGLALAVRATRGGLVRIPAADLVAAGIDPATAAVNRRGEEIPSHLDGGALLFASADFESPWSREQTFWVAARTGPALPMADDGVPPTPGAVPDLAGRRAHYEQDTWFAPESRQGDASDRWFWARVFTGGPPTASVVLPVPLADSLSPATLTVELQGLYDDPSVVDEHRVRVDLGGVILGEVTLDAHQRMRATFVVPAGIVTGGDLALDVTNLSTALSHVGLDGADLEWVAPADAVGGDELAVVSLGAGVVTAGGFATAPAWVVDETDPAAPRLLPVAATFDGSAWLGAVDAGAGRVLRFVTAAAPNPATWSAHSGRDPLAALAGADYLVIAASPLVDDARGFADYRATAAGGGFRTRVVDVSDLYDVMSFGDVDPAAVRRFLQRAAREWPSPKPRYVLLVGDSDVDPLDHLEFGVPSALLLAPRLSTSVLDVASDVVSAILDGDELPDLAIGRIPARDPSDVQTVLAKTVAYESAPRDGWDLRQVLVSDDDLPDFDALAAELGALLPVGMASEGVSAAALGTATTKARLLGALGDGAALLTYAGHGGVKTFGAEGFLTSEDVPSLANERFPVVLAVDCMNAYFDHPYYDALSEELVRAPNGGAVAFFGSSAITRSSGHRDIALAFHNAFWREPALRLGDVAARAHASVAWRTDAAELIGSFLLLGDPALRLNVNGTPFAQASLASVSSGRAELSSMGSHDPDGDELFYRWEILSTPASASAADAFLSAADTATPILVSTTPGLYRVRLTVADAHRAGPPDDVLVEIRLAPGGGGDAPGRFGCAVGEPSEKAFLPGLATLAALLGLAVAARFRSRSLECQRDRRSHIVNSGL